MKQLSVEEKQRILAALDYVARGHQDAINRCRRCTQPDNSVDESERRSEREKATTTELFNKLTRLWTTEKTVVTKTKERVFK